ncbi:hypothetical protein A3A09_02630 [Candidatus Nomurabacteria bacterium RIFCSPLOWO2_01_FULL_42_20]|uniref:Uncharacterized protein n=1 Tax=Candidatus Nomurabacteria bacterium RIFCSPHIGHO2_01_FULL_42_16 TaxID=1801743 RepID=A0A1F6VLF7_9BACT|nr:MAG: hypothetical protein A2824_03780 [Candidatus Nomurabacteria bacterium RIFCSPHIGHO2_01_FULL_42_16]OGI92655.1 MAG: hypothetical protein A3A09_02630 [Candidatus Nomurabacteria bacterium RIFCSPLOWO2_01_FULL_42_20]
MSTEGPQFEKEFRRMDIEAGYKKAERMLNKFAIKTENFYDLYGRENVEKDLEYVKKMKSIFEKESSSEAGVLKRMSILFETIIFDRSERSEWLGRDVVTIKTSHYDDIANGVDLVAEFLIKEEKESFSHLAFAVDVTFSAETDQKLKKIKKEIEEGKLSTVKYFESEHVEFRGQMENLPRVVIAASAKTVEDLNELWLEKTKENTQKLNSHFIQFQMLEEIISQLKTFRNYAENLGQEKIRQKYDGLYNLVQDIYKKRKKDVKDPGDRDNVYYDLKRNLRHFE